jgi:hypothetical protein
MTEEPGIYDVGGSQSDEPPRFEEHLVHTSAGIRITGNKQEIDLVLNALASSGFFYKTNKILYPCRDNPRRFNLYLNFVRCPALFEAKERNGAILKGKEDECYRHL